MPRLSVSGECALERVEPLVVTCWSPPADYSSDASWFDEAGSLLFSTKGWQLKWVDSPGTPPLLVKAPGPGWDGGYAPETILLGELRDGGVVQFGAVHGGPPPWYLMVHELPGKLALVTWGEHLGAGPCPTCEIGRFVARYACLPP